MAIPPGIDFLGPYDRQRDLARIYQAVHFTAWIDEGDDGARLARTLGRGAASIIEVAPA